MKILGHVIALFRDLGHADDQLQSLMEDLRGRYYNFRRRQYRKLWGTGHGNVLLLRYALDSQGRIRRLFWARAIRATRQVRGRNVQMSIRLPGPFRRRWVFLHARDFGNLRTYLAFNRRIQLLNSTRSGVALTLRNLRFAFLYGWSRRASPATHRAAADLARRHGDLGVPDLRTLDGIDAYGRELERVEREIGRFLEAYRREFKHSSEVMFEPATRNDRKDGCLRVYWGYPQTVFTRQGPRKFTQPLRGRPTDRCMRKEGLCTRSRVRVRSLVKRLLPLERRYKDLVAFWRTWRRRVGGVLKRVQKVLAVPPPEP